MLNIDSPTLTDDRPRAIGDRVAIKLLPAREIGDPLTIDDSKSSYVLIRHNVRTYVSAGVVEVIHGRQNAELTMREYQNRQSPSDAHEGWRFFLEKTGLRAGMDPVQATDARQRDLELRESKESAGNGSGIPSSLGHH